MEQFDPGMENPVWQRVLRSREQAGNWDLRAMEEGAMELVGAWRQLAGLLTGRQRELARQLYEGEQATLAALKGLAVLSGQGGEVLKLWNPSHAPVRRLLEGLYEKTHHCMVNYLACSAQPRWGGVFRQLAQREERHLTLIAQLMGMQQKM